MGTKAEKNICPYCGIDIDVAKEMFPNGFTTCKELGLTDVLQKVDKELKKVKDESN